MIARNTLLGSLLTLCLGLLGAASARATIIGVTGPADLLANPPPSVLEGALEGSRYQVFQERSARYGNPFLVEVGPGGVPTVIPGGTPISSSLVHLDPVDSTPTDFMPGEITITFNGDILGFYYSTNALIGPPLFFCGPIGATDCLLGAPCTLYDQTTLAGDGTSGSDGWLADGTGTDKIAISGNVATISLAILDPRVGYDQIRFVTRVPAPATLLLLGLGLAGLGARRRFAARV